ncbi:MAG: DNA repair protein RadC [Pseudomonadota bacterium]
MREHRSRLRERFVQSGPKAIADYELLELVLFRAIPRRDVKPLAKRLIKAFGGFSQIISAPPARLLEMDGVGQAVVVELKVVEAAAQRLAQRNILGREVIDNWDALMDYCHIAMSHLRTEEFRILFLDTRNTIIADEVLQQGTVNHVPVYPREVAKRALELNASALILVHNHPSGDPTPSRADITMTEQIVAAIGALGITLHDHVIIGENGDISFRDLGLL